MTDRISELIERDTELDPNLIAAYVDGGLSPAERLAMERRLAADPEAQLLARTLRERSSSRGLILVTLAAAAVLVVGVVLWRTQDPAPGAASLDSRLATVVAKLRTAEPTAFGEFATLSDDELTQPGMRRGGGVWHAPRGMLLEAPKTFAWTGPEGATRVRLTLRGGSTNWSQDVDSPAGTLDAPTLAPGRYVVTMRALDALAGQPTRASFVVADSEERADVHRAVTAIRDVCCDDLEDLVVTHYALRNGLFDLAHAAGTKALQRGGAVEASAARLLVHRDALLGRATSNPAPAQERTTEDEQRNE